MAVLTVCSVGDGDLEVDDGLFLKLMMAFWPFQVDLQSCYFLLAKI